MSNPNRSSPRAATSTSTHAYPAPSTPPSSDSPSSNHHRRQSSILTPEQQQFLERRLSNRRPTAAASPSSSAAAVDTLADSLQARLNTAASPARAAAQPSITTSTAPVDAAGTTTTTQPSSTATPAVQSVNTSSTERSSTSEADALSAATAAALSPPVDSSDIHRRVASDRVEAALQRRNSQSIQPPPTGVDTTRVSPLLHAPQKQLERNLARANLYHALKHRPSLDDLQSQGIYVNNKVDANSSGRSTIQQLQQQYETNEAIASGAIQRPAPTIAHNTATPSAQQAYTSPSSQPTVYNFHQSATTPPSANNAQSQQLYQRRSKLFHLTRILLRAARTLAETQQLTGEQVGALKDLIVDSNTEVLDAAEQFDSNNDSQLFRQTLIIIATKVAAQLSSHNGA